MDQSKKTMRHFYCRDVLWETFEQMANDFDCSIDYLINEAMRYYARSKNYQSSIAAGAALPAQGAGMMGAAPSAGAYGGGNGPGSYGAPAPSPMPHVARRTGAPPPPPAGVPQQ